MLNVVKGKLLRMMTFIRNEFDVLHTTVPERVVFYARRRHLSKSRQYSIVFKVWP